MKKNENTQAEIDRLAERSGKMSRRTFAKGAAFAIPALSVFTVSRQALGQTGSGGSVPTGGMMNNGMMNNGMMNNGMMNNGMMNNGMMNGFF